MSAASATDIPAVQAGDRHLLPGATVTDQDNLAGEVTGSLASASSLAANLGRWLSVAVLAAAFGVASVLTMAAVSRRVREFGTLKALGWRSRRVVGQVMGESFVIGVGGAVLGVALGYGGTALIDALAPKLTATVGASNAASVTGPAALLGADAAQALTGAGHSVSVTLQRAGHGEHHRPRGAAGAGRRADRGVLRRMAGGPAAARRGAGEGGVMAEHRLPAVRCRQALPEGPR